MNSDKSLTFSSKSVFQVSNLDAESYSCSLSRNLRLHSQSHCHSQSQSHCQSHNGKSNNEILDIGNNGNSGNKNSSSSTTNNMIY